MNHQPSTLNHQLSTITPWRLSQETNFIAHIEANFDNTKTINAIYQHIRVLARWYENAFQRPFEPAALTGYALETFQHHSLNIEKVTANTWNARYWAIDILCKWLSMPDLIESIGMKNAGAASARYRALTPVEYRRLNDLMEADIRAAKTDTAKNLALRNRALICLMLQAGMRVFEAVAPTWADLTINERSGEIIIRNGKGAKQRVVQVNKHLRTALSAWKSELAPNSATTAIFKGANGKTITTRTAQRIVEDLAQRIGAPDITCHCLRYAAAKMCERHNSDRGLSRSEVVRLVQNMLGHSTYDMTDRYLKSGVEERQSAMDWE